MTDDVAPAVTFHQLAAIKQGLKAIKVGMRVNSSYTPQNCRRTAERLTGKKFKARDYDGMIAALQEMMDAMVAAAAKALP